MKDKITKAKTFTADIYIGTGYFPDTIEFNDCRYRVHSFLQSFCDSVGFCVSIQETDYIYTRGKESGFKITLINYPRFPKDPETIKEDALLIASTLRTILSQKRCSIVCSDGETIMLGE